jgi:hypothetical protein
MKRIREYKKHINVFTKTLGPVDIARFIQGYETDSEEYTKKRYE